MTNLCILSQPLYPVIKMIHTWYVLSVYALAVIECDIHMVIA